METVHLIVEKGPDAGRVVTVPSDGARLGRSSRNDVVLTDPVLSRYHCRLYFKPGEGLWVTDLGSANQTLLNGKEIQDARIQVGDRVTVGDTVLRVLNDEPGADAAPGAPAAGPGVDLGLAPAAPAPARAPGRRLGLLAAVAVLVIAAAAAVWLPKGRAARPARPAPIAAPAPGRGELEIDYEKVEATAANVFRYHLTLSPARVLAVEIDDVVNGRHVRKEKPLDPEYVANLARIVRDSGFFALTDDYLGIQPDILDTWDLAVRIGPSYHRTRVVNRIEPDRFKQVREQIEECGKNELGLWAIQFSTDKLRQLAGDAFLVGKRLYDEKTVQNGNLAGAIRTLNEADWYLETVEPKPDYYQELVKLTEDAKRELQARFDDLNFSSERAIRLREWEKAAAELRTLLDAIPDRSDPRNQQARKKLLDVESHLGTRR